MRSGAWIAAVLLALGTAGCGDDDDDNDTMGDGDADSDADADGDGDADADADGDADGDGDGDGDADCVVTSDSDLDGVSLEIANDACVFTLAEAAAGISIPWQLTIEEAGDVTPTSPNRCDRPDESGLMVTERLSGGDQLYCICDAGKCMPWEEVTTTMVPGVYDRAFEWDGRNWMGPSDTGNPEGDPFPPGTYTLQLDAVGNGPPFHVSATLEIHLVE